MMSIFSSSCEIIIHGDLIKSLTPVNVSYECEPQESKDGLGKIGGDISFTCSSPIRHNVWEIKRDAWEKQLNPSKPRWGQPGRRRRRNARFLARRLNERNHRQRAEAKWLFKRTMTDLQIKAASMQIEREVQAVMALHGVPIRNPFKG